jgi:uncharacterized membrane protein
MQNISRSELSRERRAVVRWVIASALAGIALLGLVIIVGIVTIALQPAGWVQTTVGIVLALGTAGFAWLVAMALCQGDEVPTRN